MNDKQQIRKEYIENRIFLIYIGSPTYMIAEALLLHLPNDGTLGFKSTIFL